MISKSDQATEFISRLKENAERLQENGAQAWVKELRRQGIARFLETGIPTVKDEEWKYTSLAGLSALKFELSKDGKLAETGALKKYCSAADINLVFVNGLYSSDLSNTENIPAGITVTTIQEAVKRDEQRLKDLMTKYAVKEETAFVALNDALNQNGAYIDVREKIVEQRLIHIVHVTSSDHALTVCAPKTLISLGASSELSVLESHIAFNDQVTYLANAVTDVCLSENAVLHYCKVQKESLKAFHVGHTRVWQERNSNFDGFSLMAGAKLARNDLDIILSGEGANANLNALYSVYNDQHVDNHTSVDHRVPNCTSNQLYKGVLNNSARAVFNGKIFVRSIAQQTNSYQLNKNLLLGKDCRVDTKPQLEIDADDVKCTHGATIGQLDEDELFYLQTRCIPRSMATKMLVHGFADELFAMIKNEHARQKCHDLVQPSFEVL